MPDPTDPLKPPLPRAASADLFGGSAPADTWSDVSEAPDSPRPATSSGTPVDVGDRYTDLGPIGAGGWGEVRRVRDPRLHRVIAREQLHQRIASSSEAVARFLDEARVTAYLDHPGVVPVHELGRTADGAWYFTMKEVRGRTLASVLQERRENEDEWPLVRVVEAFRRCCEAVAFAHARGVIHRDLKPGNLMVGEYGEAVVLDWGLARRPGGCDTARAPSVDPLELVRETSGAHTLAGARVGTPQYMSPEHASGIPGRVDARSDVFSLGCVLYEILAGATALEGDTVSDLLGAATLAKVRPLTRSDAPPELVSVAMKALARDPADRYPNAAQMAEDLGAWLGGAPVRAHQYSAASAVRRYVERHRAAFAVGAIATVLLAVSAAVAVLRLADERDRAVAAEQATQLALSDAMAESAQAALDAGLRPDADLLAAAALAHGPAPLARGVLAALSAKPIATLSWQGWGAASGALVTFGGDARALYLQDALGHFSVLDTTSAQPARQVGAATGLHLVMDWTPEGLVIGGGRDGSLKLVDAADLSVKRVFGAPGENAQAAHLIDGGRSVLARCADGVVRAWSLADGTLLGAFGPTDDDLREVQATASAVYAATTDGPLKVWSRATGALIATLPDSRLGAGVLRASPDERWLAEGAGSRLAVWDLAAGAAMPDVAPPAGQVQAMAWSPDSRVLATGLPAGQVELRLAPG